MFFLSFDLYLRITPPFFFVYRQIFLHYKQDITQRGGKQNLIYNKY
jgi:hypothetical protein